MAVSSIDTTKEYRIINAKNPSLCLEVARASKSEGANIRLFTINNSEAQFWRIDPRWKNSNGWTYYLTYRFCGKVATLDKLVNAGNVCIRNLNTKKYPYSGWQFTKTGRTTTYNGVSYPNYWIHLPSSAAMQTKKGWVLDGYGTGTPTSGTNVNIAHLDSLSSTTDQEWILVPSPEIKRYGIYSVYSYRDTKLLWDVNGLTKINGASLKLHASTGGNNQKFKFMFQGTSSSNNDIYKIASVYSDKLVTLADKTPSNDDDIFQWEDLNLSGINNRQCWEIRYLGAYPNKINGLSNLPVVDIRQTVNASEYVIDSKNASQSTTSNVQLNTVTHDSSEWWILVPTTAVIDNGEIPTDLSAWNWHWDSVDYELADEEDENPIELLEPNIDTPQSLYFYGYNDETPGLVAKERYWRLNPRIMPSCVMPMSWYLLGANKIQGSIRFRYLDAVTNTWSSWTAWTAWKAIVAEYLKQAKIDDPEYIPGSPYTAFIMKPDELKMFVLGEIPYVSGLNQDMYVSLPPTGANEVFAKSHYGISGSGLLEDVIHIAKRYQWQYRLRTAISNSSWDGSLQGPTVTSPTINVVFKPKWEIVNDPTSSEPWESWIPYFWFDGLHIPYETDYEYGANKCNIINYDCVQTTDETAVRKLNPNFTATNDAEALEFVIPLQYIFWPDENTEINFTYRISTDFYNGWYPGNEEYTISEIAHRPSKTLSATPISVLANDGATLKVRIPHVDKERLFYVYFDNDQPIIKEVTYKKVYSTYTDFLVEYQFEKDLELWIMVYDEINWTWGYDCSTVLDKSDSRIHPPCHAFNWDGGSFILECRKDDYLETEYSMSKNSETYKLNNRKYETVIFGNGFSSRINSVEGFVAKDLTENDFKDIQALLNQGHVRYRSPDGTVHNVAVISASWNTKYYGDYDGNNIIGSEVKLELVEETI